MIEEWQYELKLGNEKALQRVFSIYGRKVFSSRKVSLYHHSALLPSLHSDNQIVCHNDAFHIPLKKYHQCITISD